MELKPNTIHNRLAAIMDEAKAIGKDSRNESQKFNFRGIDAVMNHLHPIFAKHGVVILPEVLDERVEERQTRSGGNLIYRILKIKFRFVAADGSEVSSVVLGEGMDSGDKGANKAMAVALKYALTQMLLLPYDEIDPDADSHPPSVPKTQAAPAPASKAKAPPMTQAPSHNEGEQSAVMQLGDVQAKSGTSARGDWTRWSVKADDGQYYSTFDNVLGEKMRALSGETVRMVFELKATPKGDQRTIISIEPEIDGAAEQADGDEKSIKGKEDDLPF